MLAAYFDLARYWRAIDHIMALTIPELLVYHRQASRIAKSERDD